MQSETNRTRAIPPRNEIDARFQWRLADIFPTEAAWEAEFSAAEMAIRAMDATKEALQPEASSILAALMAVDALLLRLDRLYCYARMRRDEDSRLPGPQALCDRAESLMVRGSAAAAFLRPALLAMPEALLRACLKDAAFEAYDRMLAEVLRSRPHTLDAAREALLAEAAEIGGAPQTIFTMLTEADLAFPKITGEDGSPIAVSEGRFLSLLQSRDARVRREAYEAVMQTYGAFGNTLAATYAASVKNDVFDARAHHFPSAIEASLFASEIPVSVYDALLQAVEERIPALHRYLAIKQRALGLDTLNLWDLYVDASSAFDMKLDFDEAYALVLSAVTPLGDAYVDTLASAKAANWVDAFENAGKAHGAYSWGPYGVHPFVLMNFEGTLDSASTLAHELGHSMHSYYANKAQPHAKAGYTLFAAEVASTVNEILLSQHLLSAHPDAAAQQSILGGLLEHFRTTVFRQTLFAAFERETHAMQERGEALTQDALAKTYLALNERYYGGACQVTDLVRHEWMRIPHFYRAFYVYQYATGFSAAVSIARRLLKGDRQTQEGYLRFLSSGGALPPLDALRLAGVDMANPQPVREALDWFEGLLAAYEQVQP